VSRQFFLSLPAEVWEGLSDKTPRKYSQNMADFREGTFFLGGERAGASEGRVISESEHQKGRAIPHTSCELFKGGSHIFSGIF